MEHYRISSHTVYDIKYHVVQITKYRYLKGDRKLEEFVRQFAGDRFSSVHKIDTDKDVINNEANSYVASKGNQNKGRMSF